ncbi:8-oxo-dGTP diphosphatase [Malonomonas rubra DSM 5091]|uniref:8-oxo-dGTP diphosphatase n=1 Tax=Malonomonas rubra DSM 5091 TaxID=1122189 RepID=A0A1M6IBW5_MALRU|nr:NUDIX hydrolase [Malonomonas rubra]SHJ31918.1 8-oxo-dGTP diphosphatase [Malonomonas rubra DSM 5091]
MSQPKHVVVVSCMIRNTADEILLVKHHLRGWEIPQGRVEEREALIYALSREVLEEAGVTICNAKPAIIWSKVSDPAAVIFCFTAQHSSGEPTPSEETPEAEWCPADKVLERITHPVNRDRIKALLEHDGNLHLRSYATGPYRILS